MTQRKEPPPAPPFPELAKRLVFVHGDDWIGVYLDGKLLDEGHSISAQQLVEVLAGEWAESRTPDEAWLEDEGTLPDVLTDVKLAEEE